MTAPLNLVSRHTIVREYLRSDAAAMFDVYGDPEVTNPLGLSPLTDKQVEGLIVSTINTVNTASSAPRKGYHLAIAERETGRAIGAATLGLDPHQPSAACIGFALRKSAWGHGHGTRTARLLVGFAFEQLALHRVWAACLPTNEASARTLLRTGMTREGTIRGHLKVGDRWCDTATYAILREEWRQGNE